MCTATSFYKDYTFLLQCLDQDWTTRIDYEDQEASKKKPLLQRDTVLHLASATGPYAVCTQQDFSFSTLMLPLAVPWKKKKRNLFSFAKTTNGKMENYLLIL